MTVPAGVGGGDGPALPDTTRVLLPGIGEFADAQTACDAVEATLLRWLPSYVASLAAATGLQLGILRVSDQLPDVSNYKSYATPGLYISTAGIVGRPLRAQGSYQATWAVDATVVDRGGSYRDTQRRVRRWVTLMRLILAQHRGLDGAVSEADWTAEGYARGPQDAARTLGVGAVTVNVTLDGLVDLDQRPELPDPGLPAGPNVPPGVPPTVAPGGVIVHVRTDLPDQERDS